MQGMPRLSSCLVLVPFWLLACGGSAPPAESPESASAADPAAASEAASEPGSSAPASEDAWEGEAEATSGSSSGSSGSAAGEPAPPDTKGEETRTTEVIAKIIQGNRKPFRDCFEKGKKEIPTLKGMMTVHFVLDPEGGVKTAELNAERSDIKSPVVVDCSIAVLKGMKFPPSSRGMESTINYPFNFN